MRSLHPLSFVLVLVEVGLVLFCVSIECVMLFVLEFLVALSLLCKLLNKSKGVNIRVAVPPGEKKNKAVLGVLPAVGGELTSGFRNVSVKAPPESAPKNTKCRAPQ